MRRIVWLAVAVLLTAGTSAHAIITNVDGNGNVWLWMRLYRIIETPALGEVGGKGQVTLDRPSRVKLGMDHQFDGRPVIGICNTWSDLNPCNAHLDRLARNDRGLEHPPMRGWLAVPVARRATKATIAISTIWMSPRKPMPSGSAISRSWSWVTVPTFSRLGSGEPLSMPAAFFNKSAAGGVFKMKEKLLS